MCKGVRWLSEIIRVFCLLIVIQSCLGNREQRLAGALSELSGNGKLRETITHMATPFEMKWPESPKTETSWELNVIETGAIENKLSTAAFQQAIDRIFSAGGGRVIVPAGNWLTGRLILRSNVNLHFEEGAILRFHGSIESFLPAVYTRVEGIEIMSLGSCLYAFETVNTSITGKGVLIGPEDDYFKEKANRIVSIDRLVNPKSTVDQRKLDGQENQAFVLPMMLSFIACKNVYVEGVRIKNSLFWTIVPIYCDGVAIRDVQIDSPENPQADGIDLESTKNVLIEYCRFNTGGHCIAFKAGRGNEGVRINQPTESVVVRDCQSTGGNVAVAFGSETAGTIRNVLVTDCRFEGVDLGISFRTRLNRGGGCENLHFKNLIIKTEKTALKCDMTGISDSLFASTDLSGHEHDHRLVPYFKNIFFKNLNIESKGQFLKLIGLPQSHIQHIQLESLTVQSRKIATFQDVNNVLFRDLNISCSDPQIQAIRSKHIFFLNSRFPDVDSLCFELIEMNNNEFKFKKISPKLIRFLNN